MNERICSMTDCDRRHCARGLCKRHYYAAGFGYTPRPCRVIGCDRTTSHKVGDGLCEMHYARIRRTGTLTPGKYYKPWLTAAEVLADRSEPRGDCALWTGSLNHAGYPSISGESWQGHNLGHRFSWALVNGPIPDGMEIDHACHTADPECDPATCEHRRCVNPDHLELVTHDENMRRQFGRVA